jgi:hypothetical protein
MILESVVIGLCLGGYECSKAPQAYYLSNPGLQSWVKTKQEKYKEYFKDTPIPTIAGFGFFALGGKARIKISKNISVEIEKDRTELSYIYVF